MSDGTSKILSVRLIFEPGNVGLAPFATPDPSEFYRFNFDDLVMARRVQIEAVMISGENTGAK